MVENLAIDQIEVREQNGCDAPALPRARYAVLCPGCDGAGCEVCEGDELVPRRGFKSINRCPASFADDEFMEYLRRRSWAKRGVPPYEGPMDEWPGRYIRFIEELESEILRVEQAEMEAERNRQRAK
jgi:hypothetical protein